MIDPARRALLASVHIAKKELAIGDDAWGDLVARIAEDATTRSSGLMTDFQLGTLKAELVRLGAKFENRGRPKAAFVKAKKAHARKIWAQWTDLGKRGLLRNPSREALRAFCAKMARTGAATTDPDFLTYAQAQPVIEALKAMQDRGLKDTDGAPEPEDIRA